MPRRFPRRFRAFSILFPGCNPGPHV
jgi:hypothetical protein